MIGAVFSVSPSGGMGKDGKLLYDNIKDMKLFKENTTDSVVIMGRATWESLPKKPLMNRINVVVTRNKPLDALKYDDTYFISITECDALVKMCSGILHKTDIYIIGGARLLLRYVKDIEFMYISHFKEEKEADTHLPVFDMEEFNLTYEEDFGEFVYKEYQKPDILTKKVLKLLDYV